MTSFNYFEILGTICGFVYIYQEYKASIFLWITGLIMPILSCVVYYDAGLYADFGINIYYALAAFYGFFFWMFGKKKDEPELPITHTPCGWWFVLVLMFLVSFVVIAYILINHTDSDVPWWDSFTTAFSIVGMLMLARKWVEQWLAWIVVDAVCTFLYIYKGLYFYSFLYAVYALVALFGYRNWLRMMNGTTK